MGKSYLVGQTMGVIFGLIGGTIIADRLFPRKNLPNSIINPQGNGTNQTMTNIKRN